MQNTQVTFSMSRGFSTVEIYLDEEIIDSVDVHKFAKVIEDHDRISRLEDSSKKYYDLSKLWYQISEELATEYYNRVDPSKLDALSSLGYFAMFPANREIK